MNHVLTFAPIYERYLTRTIAFEAGVCALSVFLYGAFLLLAVAHTASRTTAERQMGDIVAEVTSLETQYLDATKSITPVRADELGFVTPTKETINTVYATAALPTFSLRMPY